MDDDPPTQQQSVSESPTDVDTTNIPPEEQSEYDRFFDEATFDDIKEIADILGIAYQVSKLSFSTLGFSIFYSGTCNRIVQ